MMQINKRNCLGCGTPLPDPFLDLGEMPFANSYVDPKRASEAEPLRPLAVAYCEICHLVQLVEQVSPAELFSEYLYFSSYSESWLAHARHMADALVRRLSLGPTSRVVEIASNDGYLLQYFQQRGVPVVGVEPARNIAAEAQRKGIPTVNRFFEPALVPELVANFGEPDLIIGVNVFAHVPATNDFLRAIHDCLKTGGYAVLEFPYIRDLLDHGEFDTIYHEHVFYFSLSAVKILAERAGLQLVDAERQPVHGGSLRVFLCKSSSTKPTAAVEDILLQEQAAGLTTASRYIAFSRQVEQVKRELLRVLDRLRATRRTVAAYGAPAKGNTLLNYCGIDTTLIDFTVDRSPHKQGFLLPGSRIPIFAPEELQRRMPDYALILPWNIADEIIRQQQVYVESGGRFIIPIPRPHLAAMPRDATIAAQA